MTNIATLQARQQALTEEIRIKQAELRELAKELDTLLVASQVEQGIKALEAKYNVQIARPAGVASAEEVNGG